MWFSKWIFKALNGWEAKKLLANIITSSRFFFSFLLLFFPTFSPQFYVFYIATGVSDMIDGTVARKMGTESAFGAKLDSAADLFFVIIAFIKIFPQICLPFFIWIWTGIIAIVKVSGIIVVFIKQKQFTIPHSISNKITGFLLFIFPLTIPFVSLWLSAGIVCVAASFAAILEIGKSLFFYN